MPVSTQTVTKIFSILTLYMFVYFGAEATRGGNTQPVMQGSSTEAVLRISFNLCL